MEEEQSPLIPRRASSISSPLFCCKIYKQSLVHSKGAIIVLIWLGVITISTAIMLLQSTLILPAISIWVFPSVCLFFPVLGYVGEKWTRYKVIMSGVTIIVISYAINVLLFTVFVILDVHHEIKTTIEYLCVMTLILALFGFGLCMANIIQFGTDQLQFAPSQHLAAFARWSVCVFVVGWVVPSLLKSIAVVSVEDSMIIEFAIHCLGFFLLVAIATFGCCYKRHLIIESPALIDPVKIILRVMKYAWKHKYPVRRSAFTYGEQPSRLDLAKERYGGPFSTEKVENVKSFWHIVLVLLSMIGYDLSNTSGVGKQYVNAMKENTTLSFLESVILKSSQTVPNLVVVIGIIIFQLVIVPFFYNYIPGMLKRMWIGVLLALFSSTILTVISIVVNNSLQELNHIAICGVTSIITISCPYYVLIIPQLLSGVGYLFTFMTSLEFILAQAPHYMQGTLIGMLYLKLAVAGFCTVISISTPVGCYWGYNAAISGFIFISLIIYSIAAYRYKYRKCNELSDINFRITIEEIYERNLQREQRKLIRQ